ncbi:DUF5691 domain-containing protein [Nocardioides sp. 616]|uniref:DUF5691 domain-containing protein n=1 Tax=Nocardioides sp. 616 TaxID=2268090 RepID=UPI0013B45840|nr:DUF5691 domain-containing protein [Nocardioides sp. 616]
MTTSTWLSELQSAALLGTARREPPLVPALPGPTPGEAGRDVRLLELAALADVLRRAGRLPQDGPATPAPPAAETQPTAPARAMQLLELLLRQPPLGKPQRDRLVVTWLQAAAATGLLVGPRLLPDLFLLATTRPAVAQALPAAVGARGAWLAALNPDWRDLLQDGARTAGVEPPPQQWAEEWPSLPTVAATEMLTRVRRVDPGQAREVLEAHWGTLGAKERRAHLESLHVGLGPDDEALLESALDDRAASVRQQAAALLDRLPASARAARMAGRLAGLVRVTGMLRKSLEVDVPGDPDGAGVRDGLALPRGGAEPDRRAWLRSLVRGAPLDLWTLVSGRDAAGAAAMVADDDVRRALAETAVLRRDPVWAAALLAGGATEPDLVQLLPAAEREARVVSRLRKEGPAPGVLPELAALPTPWGLEVARAVLDLLPGKHGELVVHSLGQGTLSAALPVELAPVVQRCLDRLKPEDRLCRRALTDVLQFGSFHSSITEAFS